MATEEQQDSVSMVEVLEEEQKLEEDANAVLGGSDPVHCTYPKVYSSVCHYQRQNCKPGHRTYMINNYRLSNLVAGGKYISWYT